MIQKSDSWSFSGQIGIVGPETARWRCKFADETCIYCVRCH